MRWLLILSIFLGGCSSFLYYPNKETKFLNPKQLNVEPEEVWFTTQDGNKIHAWWFNAKTKTAKGSIVFFHGNAENLTSHFALLSWITEKGYNYLIFDYPGYGLSSGEPNPYSCLMSGHAAVEWVHENKDKRPLIIYGQSLGGNIALRTLLDEKDKIPMKAMIADSTFSSYRSIARYKLSTTWITWLLQPLGYVLLSDKYAPGDLAEISPIPLLVIHGQHDMVVEPRWGERIYKEAKEPKTIWRIESKEGHGATYFRSNQSYREKLVDYLNVLK
jgi:alpha-beta hydrolase superfamily lysophospholipase